MSPDESALRRAINDFRALASSLWFQILTVACGVMAAVTAVAFSDTHSSKLEVAAWAAVSAGGGWVLPAMVAWLSLLVAAPTRQRNDLRRERDAAAKHHLSLRVLNSVGTLTIDVLNGGATALFVAETQELSGLRWEWSRLPLRLPWVGPTEFVGRGELQARFEKRLFGGEHGFVPVLGLDYPVQARPPFHRFTVYNLGERDGWCFASSWDDELPAFLVIVAVLGESIEPMKIRAFGVYRQRILHAVEVPLVPTTPEDVALAVLAERFTQTGTNPLAHVFAHSRELLEWRARGTIRPELFEAFSLADILEHQQGTAYDPRGMPYTFDRYRLNSIGRAIVQRLESGGPNGTESAEWAR